MGTVSSVTTRFSRLPQQYHDDMYMDTYIYRYGYHVKRSHVNQVTEDHVCEVQNCRGMHTQLSECQLSDPILHVFSYVQQKADIQHGRAVAGSGGKTTNAASLPDRQWEDLAHYEPTDGPKADLQRRKLLSVQNKTVRTVILYHA